MDIDHRLWHMNRLDATYMLRQEQSTHMRELIIAEWPDIESGSADMLKKKKRRKENKREELIEKGLITLKRLLQSTTRVLREN
jgi:hypothetical protein